MAANARHCSLHRGRESATVPILFRRRAGFPGRLLSSLVVCLPFSGLARVWLATINWINPSSGNWNTASNWRDSSNVNRVPGAGDNVVIPDIGGAGADQVITFNTGSVSVSSITSAEQLSVTAGTLTDNGN